MYVIREKVFRLAEDSNITNESGQPVLHVEGKIMSLHSRLILRDPAGREVAQVHRKLAALRPTYEITIDGKNVAEVRQHPFSPFQERLTIDLPGMATWRSAATCSATNSPFSGTARPPVTVSKRWLSLTASFAVDIASGENDLLILASVLALDLAMDQKRHAA
jgi:uncharacterized protein YxjI